MKRLFQRVIQRVFKRPPPKPFRPDYSADFLRAIEPVPGSLAAVTDYFRQRAVPVVFHDGCSMKQLLSSSRQQYPEWCQRLRKKVQQDVSSSFSIYGLTRDPLLGGDHWDLGRPGPGGDLQYQKKIHRFSFLPGMVLDALMEPSDCSRIFNLLEDWVQYASGEKGKVCFDSNLAVIQRLMATTWAWVYGYGLDAESKTRLDNLLLPIIANDIRFLNTRLGDSYGNNHLLADYFAAWFITLLFPEFAGQAADIDFFEARWVDELLRQTYPDGGSFEQSMHYHEFACEMGIAYLLLSRCNHRQMPEQASERIKNLLLFQMKLGGLEGQHFRIGDCIEDNFFPLGVSSGLSPSLSREVYRALFDPGEVPATASHPAVECAYWLLGGLAKTQAECTVEGLPSFTSFPDAGFYCFALDSGVEVLFRTGPAESTDICAGHAHADFLSVYLKINGQHVVVDAGTYTYRSNPHRWPKEEPPWRHYFAGPEAHNGVVKAGFDPLGDYSGDFRPKHTAARVRSSEYCRYGGLFWVHGKLSGVPEWSGYSRGVVCVQDYYTIVYDCLAPNQNPDWAGFQFAPGVELLQTNSGYQVEHAEAGGVHCCVSADFSGANILSGSMKPLGGWVSDVYGDKKAAPQLRLLFRQGVKVSALLIDVHTCQERTIEVVRKSSSLSFHVELDGCEDWLFLDIADEARQIPISGGELNGRAVFIRLDGQRVGEVRATDLFYFRLDGELELKFKKREQWVKITNCSDEISIETASGQYQNIEVNFL